MSVYDMYKEMENADQLLLLMALQEDGTNVGQVIIEKVLENGSVQTAHSVVMKTTDTDEFFDSVSSVVGLVVPKQLNVAVVARDTVLTIVVEFNGSPSKPYVGYMSHEELNERLESVAEAALEAGQPFVNFLDEVENLTAVPSKIMEMANHKMRQDFSDLKEIVN